MIKNKNVETAFIFGDVHNEYYDPKAWDINLQLLYDVNPDVVYINGDFLDFYAISRFEKDPNRQFTLQDEIDHANTLLDEFKLTISKLEKKYKKKIKILFIEGNHEARLRKYLWTKAPELSGLKGLTVEGILNLEERGIEYVISKGRSAYSMFGKIKVGHFDVAMGASCASEKKLVNKYACSVVQAHTHRLGMFFKSFGGDDNTVVGVGGGCLCDTNPDYCSDPDWQQGAIVIKRLTEENRYHIIPIPILMHEAFYNEKIYKPRGDKR